MRVVATQSFAGTEVNVARGNVCECSDKFGRELIAKGFAREANQEEKKTKECVHLGPLEAASRSTNPAPETADAPIGPEDIGGEGGE